MKKITFFAPNATRPAAVSAIGRAILSARENNIYRRGSGKYFVGFDGMDGSGKTHLVTRELAPRLEEMGTKVQVIKGDWSIVPKATRDTDPLKYSNYFQWFRYKEVLSPLLELIRNNSFCGELTGLYDPNTGIANATSKIDVDDKTIVLVDGLFMQHPIVRTYLDEVIYVHVDPKVSMQRQIARDTAEKGRTQEEVIRLVNEVFMPAHRLYNKVYSPMLNCDLLIDNNEIG